MLKKTLIVNVGVCAVAALLVAAVSAQPANPRYGKWKLKSDAPAPTSNVMTYEPYNGKGMKITIDAVSKDGVKSQWGYTTMFDGKDEKLVGNPGTDSGSVRIVPTASTKSSTRRTARSHRCSPTCSPPTTRPSG